MIDTFHEPGYICKPLKLFTLRSCRMTFYRTRLVFVLEYARLGSLHRAMGDEPLDETQAAQVTKQVLAGLKHLHSHKYIHCDVKPPVRVHSSPSLDNL